MGLLIEEEDIMSEFIVYVAEMLDGSVNTGKTKQGFVKRYGKDRKFMGEPEIISTESEDDMHKVEKDLQEFFYEYRDKGTSDEILDVPMDVVVHKARTLNGENPVYIGENPLVMFVKAEYDKACAIHAADPNSPDAKHIVQHLDVDDVIEHFQSTLEKERFDANRAKILGERMDTFGWEPGSLICYYIDENKRMLNIGGNHRLRGAKDYSDLTKAPFYKIPFRLDNTDLENISDLLNTHIQTGVGLSTGTWKTKLIAKFTEYLQGDLSEENIKKCKKDWTEDSRIKDQYPGVFISKTITDHFNKLITNRTNKKALYTPTDRKEWNIKADEVKEELSIDKVKVLAFSASNPGNLDYQLFQLMKGQFEGKTDALILRFPSITDEKHYNEKMGVQKRMIGHFGLDVRVMYGKIGE